MPIVAIVAIVIVEMTGKCMRRQVLIAMPLV